MKLTTNFKKYTKARAKELQALASAERTAETLEVSAKGPKFTFKLDVERRAAWKLYVELNTRIATQPLKSDEGFLREALSSFYVVFQITREILKESGPAVAQGNESLGYYAMEILNQVIRPLLAQWHPALSHWEEQRPPDASPIQHERSWAEAKKLRRELEVTRKTLIEYCGALAVLAGVSNETRKGEEGAKKKSVR